MRKTRSTIFKPRNGPTDMGPQWTDDHETDFCSACQVMFTTLTRRHHCRNCGDLFCGTCTQFSHALPDLDYHKEVRVCKMCKEELLRSNTETVFHRLDSVPKVTPPFNLRQYAHRHLRYINKASFPVLGSALSKTRVVAIVDRYLFVCVYDSGIVKRCLNLESVERIYQQEVTRKKAILREDYEKRLHILVKHRTGDVFFSVGIETNGVLDLFPGTVHRITEALKRTTIPNLKIAEDAKITDYLDVPGLAGSNFNARDMEQSLLVQSKGTQPLQHYVGQKYKDVLPQLFHEDNDDEDLELENLLDAKAVDSRAAILRPTEMISNFVKGLRGNTHGENWAAAELRKIFSQHDPIRLNTVNALLSRHMGREEELLESVMREYEPEQAIRREIQKFLKRIGYDDEYIDALILENRQCEEHLLALLKETHGDTSTDDVKSRSLLPTASMVSMRSDVRRINPLDSGLLQQLLGGAASPTSGSDISFDMDSAMSLDSPKATRTMKTESTHITTIHCTACGHLLMRRAIPADALARPSPDAPPPAVPPLFRPGFVWHKRPAVVLPLADLPREFNGRAVSCTSAFEEDTQVEEEKCLYGIARVAPLRCKQCKIDLGARFVLYEGQPEREGQAICYSSSLDFKDEHQRCETVFTVPSLQASQCTRGNPPDAKKAMHLTDIAEALCSAEPSAEPPHARRVADLTSDLEKRDRAGRTQLLTELLLHRASSPSPSPPPPPHALTASQCIQTQTEDDCLLLTDDSLDASDAAPLSDASPSEPCVLRCRTPLAPCELYRTPEGLRLCRAGIALGEGLLHAEVALPPLPPPLWGGMRSGVARVTLQPGGVVCDVLLPDLFKMLLRLPGLLQTCCILEQGGAPLPDTLQSVCTSPAANPFLAEHLRWRFAAWARHSQVGAKLQPPTVGAPSSGMREQQQQRGGNKGSERRATAERPGLLLGELEEYEVLHISHDLARHGGVAATAGGVRGRGAAAAAVGRVRGGGRSRGGEAVSKIFPNRQTSGSGGGGGGGGGGSPVVLKGEICSCSQGWSCDLGTPLRLRSSVGGGGGGGARWSSLSRSPSPVRRDPAYSGSLLGSPRQASLLRAREGNHSAVPSSPYWLPAAEAVAASVAQSPPTRLPRQLWEIPLRDLL